VALTKTGTGTLTLAATNTYTGGTTNSGGTTLVDGIIGPATVLVSGGVLGGNGTITAPVIVQSGATLSPGDFGIGTLTISNSLNLSGTTLMELNAAAGTNDLVRGLTSVTYGGTLIISNLAGSLNASNTFKLFSAGSYLGSFMNTLPVVPQPGLAWNTNTLTTDGTLRFTATVNTNPTNLTSVISANSLMLSWPADHTGWRLQSQTNSTAIGLSTNWQDVQDSTATNSLSFGLDSASGSVFYRLVFP
jgi:autotransporter-associated beta strand protein